MMADVSSENQQSVLITRREDNLSYCILDCVSEVNLCCNLVLVPGGINTMWPRKEVCSQREAKSDEY